MIIVMNTTTFIFDRIQGHTTWWIRASLLALVSFHHTSQLGTMLRSSVQAIDNHQQRKSVEGSFPYSQFNAKLQA